MAIRPGAQLSTQALRGEVVSMAKRDKVERITLSMGVVQPTFLQWVGMSLKRLSSIVFTTATSWTFGFNLGNHTSRDGTHDYREQVGNGRNNSIVMACVDLNSSAFAQSPPRIRRKQSDSSEVVSDHPMVRLIMKPNPYYGGKLLLKATMADWLFGNAYWLKVRNVLDEPVQLYWIPSKLIRPMWDHNRPNVFITHYEYSPNGKPERIQTKDVVHFRNGMDPDNIRVGLGKVGALLREIATDEEAAEYANTILRNMGMSPVVISPKNEKGSIKQSDADKIKQSVMTRTSGDRRGEPLVLGGAVSVDQIAIDPSKLDLAAIRHIPEERITAAFGTPAVILGLGSGLEHATYENVDGLRKLYYQNTMIPNQSFMADDLQSQLLADFEEDPDAFIVEFDNDNVEVLKERDVDVVDRINKELETGLMTLTEARQERGREALPGPDMLMLSSRIVPVDVTKVLVREEPVSDPGGTGSSDDPGSSSNTDNDATGKSGGGTDSTGERSVKLDTKDISESITRVRNRMLAATKAEINAYLQAQLAFVLSQLEASKTSKARINWPRLQEDFEALRGVLEPWYKRALMAVHDVVQGYLDTRYEITASDERTYLRAAALNIRGINEYTREAVKQAIAYSLELDEDTDELAARIRALHVFSDERAQIIAQTELATATNLAQIESYRASNVVYGIRITDGDQDKVCAALNGTKVKISEARSIPPLGHPNCRRRFNHITDPKEMEDAA